MNQINPGNSYILNTQVINKLALLVLSSFVSILLAFIIYSILNLNSPNVSLNLTYLNNLLISFVFVLIFGFLYFWPNIFYMVRDLFPDSNEEKYGWYRGLPGDPIVPLVLILLLILMSLYLFRFSFRSSTIKSAFISMVCIEFCWVIVFYCSFPAKP